MTNFNQNLYIIGDSHGEWDTLFRKLDHLEIDNCDLLHVGDVGIGFKAPGKQNREIELINNSFKKRNIKFLAVRGNHDDPSYFDGQINYSNFELLPDYTYREFNGEKFLFVGGAVSIDRIKRVPNMSWWKDEEFTLKPDLIKKVDVLITHSAPSWSGPFDKSGIASWCVKDSTLWDECVAERYAHDKLIVECSPKKHYCGHFHLSSNVKVGDCVSQILDIL
jgi:predicted phosphodiesterase